MISRAGAAALACVLQVVAAAEYTAKPFNNT
jgi:hypothetical protein